VKEAGLDNEEENNGEDSDFLNNPITIYYCLAHLPCVVGCWLVCGVCGRSKAASGEVAKRGGGGLAGVLIWSGSFTCRFEMLRRRLKPPCPPRGLCRAA